MINLSPVSTENLENKTLNLPVCNITDRWELDPCLYEAVKACLAEAKACFRESAKNLRVTDVEWVQDGTTTQNSTIRWIHFFVHALCDAGPLHWERAHYVKTSRWQPSERISPPKNVNEVEFKNIFDAFIKEYEDYSFDPLSRRWAFTAETSFQDNRPTLTVTKLSGDRDDQLTTLFTKAPIERIIWRPEGQHTLHDELIEITPRVESLKRLDVEIPLDETTLYNLLSNILRTPALEELTIKGQHFSKKHCRLISQILVQVPSLQSIDLSDCSMSFEGIALLQKAHELSSRVEFIKPYESRFPGLSLLSTPLQITDRQVTVIHNDVTNAWKGIPSVGYLVERMRHEFCLAMRTFPAFVKIRQVELLENRLLSKYPAHKIVGKITLEFNKAEHLITKSLYYPMHQVKHPVQSEWPDASKDWRMVHGKRFNLTEFCNHLRNNLGIRSLFLNLSRGADDETWWNLAQCIASMPNLRYLKISGQQFSSAQVYALAQALREHPSLEIFDCSNNAYSGMNIYDCSGTSVLQLLKSFETLPHLKAFSLRGLIFEHGIIDKNKGPTLVVSKDSFDTFNVILNLLEEKPNITLFEYPSDYRPWLGALNKTESLALDKRLEGIKNTRCPESSAFQKWENLHSHYIGEAHPTRYTAGNYIIAEMPR